MCVCVYTVDIHLLDIARQSRTRLEDLPTWSGPWAHTTSNVVHTQASSLAPEEEEEGQVVPDLDPVRPH